MSRTLFFYIFKDLLRIFFLTSGALAGIMSFGGLLRPLTEHGLDAGQCAKMLSYFMPAMTTYSLPIAALFATTMVYGRLSADNELVACRAAGISNGIFSGVALPALMLGLFVSIISIVFLCFIVPVFTLKVERVVYSNLAQLIANQIERTHQIKFNTGPGNDTTIFAQEAAVGQHDPQHPKEQVVTLGGLMIVSFDKDESAPKKSNEPPLQIPREFYLARQATLFIRPSKSGDEFTLEAKLSGGSTFPRRYSIRDSSQGGLATTDYGPIVLNSLIKEDTKFMDIRRLRQLHGDLLSSRRVQDQIQRIVREQQEADFLRDVYAAVSTPHGRFVGDTGRERFEISSTRGKATLHNGKLVIAPGAQFVQTRPNGQPSLTVDAVQLEMSATAISDDQLNVQVQLRDAVVQAQDMPSKREGFVRSFVVPATLTSTALKARGVDYFGKSPEVPYDNRLGLYREVLKIGNAVVSEMHARASFAVSCLILVLVGCWLGMMFKSGNFLSAFALSVMPALLCIALVVAGQHTACNIPYKLDAKFSNPLNLGIAITWTGNVAALVLATVLGVRMYRQ